MEESNKQNVDKAARYRLNSPNAADEEVDGEVIVINLVNGNYYSLLGEGAITWQMLCRGMNPGEIAAAFQKQYEGEAGTFLAGIQEFVGELEREGLVVPRADDSEEALESTSGEMGDPWPVAATPAEMGTTFEPPKLNVYIDMQKLLLLDPIHEVDDSGWPSTDS